MTPQVSLLDPATQNRLNVLQRFFEAHGLSDPGAARHEAIIAIGRTIQTQAFYLAYGDAFALLGAGMVFALLATCGLRKLPAVAGPAAAH
jgi:DHA2 family multidrug resistance protein